MRLGKVFCTTKAFRTRFGHYPESVHADQIYRTRANRTFCKVNNIRLSGPPLGRPQSDPTLQAQLKQQAREDEALRVAIEGKFGQAKRRFSLARVMAKLAETAQSAIAITFLVLNLERWLRELLTLLFGLYSLAFKALERCIGIHLDYDCKLSHNRGCLSHQTSLQLTTT